MPLSKDASNRIHRTLHFAAVSHRVSRFVAKRVIRTARGGESLTLLRDRTDRSPFYEQLKKIKFLEELPAFHRHTAIAEMADVEKIAAAMTEVEGGGPFPSKEPEIPPEQRALIDLRDKRDRAQENADKMCVDPIIACADFWRHRLQGRGGGGVGRAS